MTTDQQHDYLIKNGWETPGTFGGQALWTKRTETSGYHLQTSENAVLIQKQLENSATKKALVDPRDALLGRALEALRALMRRSQRDLCHHEETHRGGVLWEICDHCGAKWADDEGGKPEWRDPEEWDQGYAVIAEIEKALPAVCHQCKGRGSYPPLCRAVCNVCAGTGKEPIT